MGKALIKDLIVENQEFIESVTILSRAVKLEKEGNYVFVGLRRAGKTYLMLSRLQGRTIACF
jgi:predicted AAA+ superfamily ATPase